MARFEKIPKVAVVASGVNRWGERYEVTLRDMISEAGKACFDSNKNITPKDIESVTTSSVYPQRSFPQTNCAPVAAEVFGIKNPKIYQHTDVQCQSGNANLRIAWTAIASGLVDIAMVVGFEKIFVASRGETYTNANLEFDHDWEQGFGLTPPGLFALAARAHMEKYGTTEEQMAKIGVKNHNHSPSNIAAHFRWTTTLGDAMASRMIAHPLKLFDCCVNTNGAAVAILASAERAKELTDKPLWILGIGQACTNKTIANLPHDVTNWEGVRVSGQRAYEMAGVGPDDIEVAELHDCFTISELIEYEELGFCTKGEGGAFVDAGGNDYGGKIPTQTRGGLIACGHPFGATGIAQQHEIGLQLKGEAGERQIKEPRIPKIGLIQTMSGMGNQSFVVIYGIDEP